MFNKKKKAKIEFSLGSKVRDKVTGFVGVITRRTEWLNNCNTYGVKPTTLKDGVPQSSEHFDEPQLVLVEENVIEGTEPVRRTGGPERPVTATNR